MLGGVSWVVYDSLDSLLFACSVLGLVSVVDLLAVTSGLHARINLANHLLAHHLCHWVDWHGLHRLLLWHTLHHLRLNWHHLRSQHILVPRIVDLIDDYVLLCLANTACHQPVLDLVKIKAHLLTLLHELLFLLSKVTRNLTHLCVSTHSHLLLNTASFFLAARVRIDIVLAHPVKQL